MEVAAASRKPAVGANSRRIVEFVPDGSMLMTLASNGRGMLQARARPGCPC
jgi:hypothetical protein